MLLPFREHPARSIRIAQGRVNIWDGGFRTSKTVVSLSAFLTWLASDEAPRGDRCAFIGYTQESIAANVLPALQKLLGVGAVAHKQGEIRMLGRVFRVLGGATDKDQDRIAGMTLDAAYIDEASRLAESMWLMTFNRLSKEGSRLYATTNPASPTHWLYKLIVKPAGVWLAPDGTVRFGSNPDVVRLTLRPQDNPSIGPEYWEGLARIYTGAGLRRAVAGEWVSEEGAIYPALSQQIHDAVDVDDEIGALFLGLDHGTTNPTAALLVGEARQRAYVLDEFYLDSEDTGQLSDASQVARFDRWARNGQARHAKRLWVDPAAAGFRVALRDGGWPAAAGNNDVLKGIRLISSMLSTDRLRILSRCSHLIDEADSYKWDDDATAKGEDKPLKVDDHAPDGLRYEAMGRSQVYRSWVNAHAFGRAA